jgi:hypothetical protein
LNFKKFIFLKNLPINRGGKLKAHFTISIPFHTPQPQHAVFELKRHY